MIEAFVFNIFFEGLPMRHRRPAEPLRNEHPHLAHLASFLLLAIVATPAATAQSPSTMRLRGTLRDFQSSHVDFGEHPQTAFGHSCANVTMSLPVSGRPAYDASGFKVSIEWTDEAARPIAPHLYADGGWSSDDATILVDGSIYVRQGEIDSFDSTVGPFGGGNSGDAAVIVTNATGAGAVQVLNNATIHGSVIVGAGADPDQVIDIDGNCTITGETGSLSEPFTIPPVVEPTGMGASQGDMTLEGGTVSGDLHVDDLEVKKNKTVEVVGDVTILCEGDFSMRNKSSLELLPGATLRLYVKGDFHMENNTSFNVDSHDPSRAEVFVMGAGAILLENSSETYANVQAPEAELDLSNSGAIGGTIAVAKLTLNNGAARIHADAGADTLGNLCGAPLADDEGMAGLLGSGGISSAASFDAWFRDVLGTNLSLGHSITLVDVGAGVYEYLDDHFHPLDGQLFGNDGDEHNHHFTYAISARFTYEQCGGQFVEFGGGDGVWLYIDGELAIDLGGVAVPTTQHLALDRLGLTDGEQYTFKLFYAQRNETTTAFRLRTNLLLLQSSVLDAVTGAFD